MSDWLLIIGMMLLTFGPRYLPLALADKVVIPGVIRQALHYVPIAVLTAIITTSSLIKDGEIAVSLDNYHLIAFVVAFFTAYFWKNLFLTVLIGLTVYGVLKFELLNMMI